MNDPALNVERIEALLERNKTEDNLPVELEARSAEIAAFAVAQAKLATKLATTMQYILDDRDTKIFRPVRVACEEALADYAKAVRS